jgi:ABC-type protease/lipase transport system fused ATPase/permease subunit
VNPVPAEHFRSSTVITITHRVHKAIDMDKVLVLDAGAVKEFDSPQMLLDNRKGPPSDSSDEKVDGWDGTGCARIP